MTRRLHDLSEDSDNLKVLHLRQRQWPDSRPQLTLAANFVNYQVARRGYQVIDVPELHPLAAECDHLLVRTDGLEFKVIAIVDRDARRDARFTLSVAQLQTIGEACLGYTGTVNGQKVPVFISVYEIGGEGDAAEAIDRLSQYGGLRAHVRMEAWLMDTDAKRVWTNRLFAAFGWRQSAERMLRSPTVIGGDAEPTDLGIAGTGAAAYFTPVLIGLLVLIFAFEAFGSGNGGESWLSPTAPALSAFGGLTRWAVFDQGEWWRLVTAPLLHTNPVHLIANCLSLGFMGFFLERMIGWRWAIAGFALSATTGALLSVLLISANSVSVGASGGAVGWGVLVFLIALRRLPYGHMRTLIMMWAVGGLLPALLPIASGAVDNAAIDYGAHLGGAVGGVTMGLLMLRQWTIIATHPKGADIAAGLGIIWVAIGVAALALGSLLQG